MAGRRALRGRRNGHNPIFGGRDQLINFCSRDSDDTVMDENEYLWRIQDDEAIGITEKIAEAEVVVWATPIYYYEMTGQMKTMIDRANALFVKDYKFRDIYMLSTAAEEDASACERAVTGLKGWIACFPKSRFAGSVFAGGVTDKGDISGHKVLDEAYDLGRNV